jgi:hypothetical protein
MGKGAVKMTDSTSETLFISFWRLCLDNLPEGSFTHRLILPGDAKNLIGEARQGKTLFGVCADDLLAPYRAKERKDHDALRYVLKTNYGIALSFEDFLTGGEEGGDPMYCVRPLNCMRVQGHDRLLVVTYCYIHIGDKNPGGPPAFKIEPGSIKFHLIESAGAREA